jgi:hypothetical protein
LFAYGTQNEQLVFQTVHYRKTTASLKKNKKGKEKIKERNKKRIK